MRFTIKDLLWLILVIACFLGSWRMSYERYNRGYLDGFYGKLSLIPPNARLYKLSFEQEIDFIENNRYRRDVMIPTQRHDIFRNTNETEIIVEKNWPLPYILY